MPRFFNATTGKELIELILLDVRNALEADDYFEPATTYPILKYGINVAVDAYPVATPHKEVKIEASYEDPKVKVSGDVSKKLKKTVNREVTVPDLAREELAAAGKLDLSAGSPMNDPSEALYGARKVGK